MSRQSKVVDLENKLSRANRVVAVAIRFIETDGQWKDLKEAIDGWRSGNPEAYNEK